MQSLKTKKTFKLATLGILGLTTIVGASFPAQAEPNGGSNGAPHAGRKHRGEWAGLNLSAEQKAQIKTIMQNARANVQAVRNDTSLSPAEKKAQLKAIHADSKSRISAVLTPEQQAKWKAMRQEKRDTLRELGLSESQKAQIKAIRQNSKAQIATVRNDTSLSDVQKREQIRAIRRDSMQRVAAILTPEQRAKLAQLRREYRGQRKNGGAPRGSQNDNGGGLNG